MCRFVIAIILGSLFVSCVLADTPDPPVVKCSHRLNVNITRAAMWKCFNETVDRHLNPENPYDENKCQSASNFVQKLDDYFKTWFKECNITTQYNTTNFEEFIEFSLRNDSFKEFYEDIACVRKQERNISNTCVLGKVGFFNITEKRKHTMWHKKFFVNYDAPTCDTNEDVSKCVQVKLNSCRVHTREYVASLFNKSQEIGECSRLKKKLVTTVPPSGPAWLTLPVKITLAIGAIIIVVAIALVIIIKFKINLCALV